MGQQLTCFEDMFVSTPATGGPTALHEIVAQAQKRGLERVCWVRRDDLPPAELAAWLHDINEAAAWVPIELYAGIETQIVNRHGDLSLPPETPEADFLLLSTPNLPLGAEPCSAGPTDPWAPARTNLAESVFLPITRALRRHRNVILADLFSILPRLGLSDSQVDSELVDMLVLTAASTDAGLLINERYRCPSLAIARRFYRAGVPIFSGTGARWLAAIGRYVHGQAIVAALSPLAGAYPLSPLAS